jgi:transposase
MAVRSNQVCLEESVVRVKRPAPGFAPNRPSGRTVRRHCFYRCYPAKTSPSRLERPSGNCLGAKAITAAASPIGGHVLQSAAKKIAILRRYLVERQRVSDLCDRYHVQPSMFYNWQKQFFENGAAAFEQTRSAPEKHQERRIAALQDKLQRKNEVVSELLEEHVKLNRTYS